MEFSERQSECATSEWIPQRPTKPHAGTDTRAAATAANAAASERSPWSTTSVDLPSAADTGAANAICCKWYGGRRNSPSSLARACSRHECGTSDARAAGSHVSSRSVGPARLASSDQERRPRSKSVSDWDGPRDDGVGYAESGVSSTGFYSPVTAVDHIRVDQKPVLHVHHSLG